MSDDLRTYLDALGAPEGSASLDAALALAGGGFEMDDQPYDETGGHYVFSDAAGVEVLVHGGGASSIFLHVRGGDVQPYGRVASLVPGLSAESSRDEVRALMGEPVRSTDGYDLYGVDGRFVHFEFDADGLRLITIMARDPAA